MLGRSQLGEEVLPGVLTILQTWRLAGTVPCTSKKNSGPAAASADIAGATAGVRSNTYMLLLIIAYRAFAASSKALRACGGDGLPGDDPFRGFPSNGRPSAA